MTYSAFDKLKKKKRKKGIAGSPVSLAVNFPRPHLVEVAQDDPYVLRLELLQGSRHLRGEALALHDLNVVQIQVRDQSIVRLKFRNKRRAAAVTFYYSLAYTRVRATIFSRIFYFPRARVCVYERRGGRTFHAPSS